jgi:hypothetical protein
MNLEVEKKANTLPGKSEPSCFLAAVDPYRSFESTTANPI